MKRRLAAIAAVLVVACAPAWADRPHIDYTTVTKTATGTGTSTADTALWTPASGTRIVLLGCFFAANNASITVELEVSDVDVIPPVRFESTGRQSVEGGGAPIYVSARDDILRYTVTGSGSWSIMCWGYEAT